MKAENGIQALEIIEREKANLRAILLDIIMPECDGFTVLEKLNKNGYTKRIPVIMITGDTSVEVEQRGFDCGAAEFITKPFNYKIVFMRVQNVIDLYVHRNKLEFLVRKQTEKLAVQDKKVKENQNQIIKILSSVVEFRDSESSNHIERIKQYTRVLAECVMKYYKEYGLNEETIDKIVNASMMHDIGKIAVPDTIILKPGHLTEDEFEVMKMHTIKGTEIIKKMSFIDDNEFFQICCDVCRYHHEKFDGKGYPDGLKGDDIPISAQLVAIAEVYDALVSERVYKKAFSKEKAFMMIVTGECGLFNPKLLECFKIVRKEFESYAEM